MERVLSSMEWLLSTETMEVVKGKLGETLEVVIRQSKQHKFILIGTGAVIGVYWYATRKHGYFRKRGIPGPKPGLFGAFADYREKGIQAFDQEVMKKYGKIVGIFHVSQPIYLISDADMIRQIMVKEFPSFVNRNADTFPKDPVLKSSLILVTDDHWKFMRSILSPTFTSGRMREMAPLIQTCVENLVKNLWTISEEGKKNLKMLDIFSMFTMDAIASTAFGVEIDCQKDPKNAFLKHANNITTPGPRMMTIILICALLPFMAPVFESFGTRMMNTSASDFFVKAVHEAIKHRKEDQTRRDFLQLMLDSHKLEEDGEEDPDTHLEFDKSKRRGMTNEEIVANALVFLVAGYDTTSKALTFMAYNLATNPECQEEAIKEIDTVLNGKPPDYDSVSQLQYLENVFLETLRIFPSAVRTSRIANEDVVIKGYLIEKGTEVHFPMFAIHNDPDYWSEPEKFDPDRFLPENRPKDYNYVYLPFGAGPRNCIGMRLAYMEVKMAMAGILQKYRFKPAPETKIPPDLVKSQTKPTDGMILMIETR